MTPPRAVVRIDHVVVEAPEGADPAEIAEAVRVGLARAIEAHGLPPSLSRDAPVLHATHRPPRPGSWEGLGAAIAGAEPPRRSR